MTPQLYLMLANIRNFVKKHHPVMFITTIGLLLIAAVFSLYQVLSVTFTDSSNATSTIDSFDQKTVDKIKGLHDSSDVGETKLVFPSPRPGPFNE